MIYRDVVEQWPDPENLVIGGREPIDPIWMGALGIGASDPSRLAQLLDVYSYLPEDILVKVDRASMAVGLEVRAPLLDQDIAEFAWACRKINSCATASESGCCAKYSIATFPRSWLIGRKWALHFLFASGCRERCAIGPKICWILRKWPRQDISILDLSNPCGQSI